MDRIKVRGLKPDASTANPFDLKNLKGLSNKELDTFLTLFALLGSGSLLSRFLCDLIALPNNDN